MSNLALEALIWSPYPFSATSSRSNVIRGNHNDMSHLIPDVYFTFHIDFMTAVWLLIFNHTRDLYFARFPLFESPRFRVAPIARHCCGLVFFHLYCRIVGISELLCIQYIARIRLLIRVLTILATGGCFNRSFGTQRKTRSGSQSGRFLRGGRQATQGSANCSRRG